MPHTGLIHTDWCWACCLVCCANLLVLSWHIPWVEIFHSAVYHISLSIYCHRCRHRNNGQLKEQRWWEVHGMGGETKADGREYQIVMHNFLSLVYSFWALTLVCSIAKSKEGKHVQWCTLFPNLSSPFIMCLAAKAAFTTWALCSKYPVSELDLVFVQKCHCDCFKFTSHLIQH